MSKVSSEVSAPAPLLNKWNLSEDDEYIDNDEIIEEEPESHLKDEMEELCKRIKQLAKLDSYSLILKELPRYVTKKHIEEFFGLPEPQRMDIEDPDPKNKRDVIVTFFDVDDFCSALIKNGRSIQSYVFDVCFDPNLHRRGSTRGRGGRGGRGHREDRDGRGRRDDRDNRDNRSLDERPRDENYHRRNIRRDGNVHREVSGDVRNQPDNYGDHRIRNEGRRSYKPANGYRSYGNQRRSDDGYNLSYQRVNMPRNSPQRMTESSYIGKASNRFGSISDSDEYICLL